MSFPVLGFVRNQILTPEVQKTIEWLKPKGHLDRILLIAIGILFAVGQTLYAALATGAYLFISWRTHFSPVPSKVPLIPQKEESWGGKHWIDSAIMNKALEEDRCKAEQEMKGQKSDPLFLKKGNMSDTKDPSAPILYPRIGVSYRQKWAWKREIPNAHLAAEGFIDVFPYQAYSLYAIFGSKGQDDKTFAPFLKDHFQEELTERLKYWGLSDMDIVNALIMACYAVEAEAKIEPSFAQYSRMQFPTATAVIALRIQGDLWIVNVGDTRAVMGGKNKAVQLSGTSSSAFCHQGSGMQRRPVVVKIPKEEIDPEDYLILTSSQIAQRASSRDMAARVRSHTIGNSPQDAASDLVNVALACGASKASAMVIPLGHGRKVADGGTEEKEP